MTVERIMGIAKECGFDEVNLLDPMTFVQSQMVRDTCATNKCGGYGKNWGCPPHSTAEEDNAKLQSYEHGLILQCIGRSQKRIDRKMYFETGKRLSDAISELRREYRKSIRTASRWEPAAAMSARSARDPSPAGSPTRG